MWKENMLTKRRPPAGMLRDGAGGVGCGVKRSSGCRQLRLVRLAGLTRCGAMEEALTWAWCSGGGLAMAE